ncbi:MAG TPA: hypothetical protein PKO41_03715 [Dokdonella sp.]|nr:hypothetical protein [Dokdonella sp.]HNS27391.1 hypothetical protein [Steroidobacteraceae bacterium]
MIVTALSTFNHCGVTYKRGDTPNITSTAARALREKGLVSFSGLPADEHPPQAGGTDSPSSASLPAQAAPQTTSSESDAGDSEPAKGKRKKAKDDPEEPAGEP